MNEFTRWMQAQSQRRLAEAVSSPSDDKVKKTKQEMDRVASDLRKAESELKPLRDRVAQLQKSFAEAKYKYDQAVTSKDALERYLKSETGKSGGAPADKKALDNKLSRKR